MHFTGAPGLSATSGGVWKNQKLKPDPMAQEKMGGYVVEKDAIDDMAAAAAIK